MPQLPSHHPSGKYEAFYQHPPGTKRRSINRRVGLQVPRDVIQQKCERSMKAGKAIQRAELLNESDYTIITTYQLAFGGIANYYHLASNMHTLDQLKRVMEHSLTKTLANKHTLSVTKVYDKYRAEIVVGDTTYKGLRVCVPREGKEPLLATRGGIALTWDIQAALEDQPQRLWGKRTELEQRLLAQVCEYCGATRLTDDIEVHHIRALKDLTTYTGRERPEWVKRMAARHRKTMVLCRTCHQDIPNGHPMRRQRIKLKDVLAMQKARTTILESRVQ